MCCKAVAVYEINKPAGEWCTHCATGGGGCAIYANRPVECGGFDCLWLKGVLEERDRPDKLHAVLYWQAGGEAGTGADMLR